MADTTKDLLPDQLEELRLTQAAMDAHVDEQRAKRARLDALRQLQELREEQRVAA